jgi:hypothetical protein
MGGSILNRIEKQARMAAKALSYSVQYHPGEHELLDRYEARNEFLGIACFGPDEASALGSAQRQACAELMTRSGDVFRILRALKMAKRVFIPSPRVSA